MRTTDANEVIPFGTVLYHPCDTNIMWMMVVRAPDAVKAAAAGVDMALSLFADAMTDEFCGGIQIIMRGGWEIEDESEA